MHIEIQISRIFLVEFICWNTFNYINFVELHFPSNKVGFLNKLTSVFISIYLFLASFHLFLISFNKLRFLFRFFSMEHHEGAYAT